MLDLAKLATDPTRETAGVLVPFDADTKLKIASVNSHVYKEAYVRHLNDARRDGKAATTVEAETISRRAYAEAILVGWEGVVDDGKPLPHTPEDAFRLLNTCPSVRVFVEVTAQREELYRVNRTEEAKALLGESSGTGLPTPPTSASSSTTADAKV